MQKTFWIGLILICLIACPTLAYEGVADSVAKYMQLGDKLSEKWDHEGAAKAYLHVLKYDPKNYEAHWKAGDAYTEIADRTDVKHKKESMFTATACGFKIGEHIIMPEFGDDFFAVNRLPISFTDNFMLARLGTNTFWKHAFMNPVKINLHTLIC